MAEMKNLKSFFCVTIYKIIETVDTKKLDTPIPHASPKKSYWRRKRPKPAFRQRGNLSLNKRFSTTLMTYQIPLQDKTRFQKMMSQLWAGLYLDPGT